MQLINSVGKYVFSRRLKEIYHFKLHPEEVQQKSLLDLLKLAKDTEYGKKYEFSSIKSIREFQERVPISSYEDLYPYIDRVLRGEHNVLWPSRITNFAKSSGTTGDKRKLVPVSRESLVKCHFQGGRDMFALYIDNYPDTKVFTGKNLSIGGNQESKHFEGNPSAYIANISAIVMKNLPSWAQYKRTPGLEITMMENWEEKIKLMAQVTTKENVASMAGSPMWIILLLQHIFNTKKANYLQEIWPNLEVLFHGSVSFPPYRPIFDLMDRDNSMRYLEVYNATEGFFGLQDVANDPSLLLMLNYDIFYEFIPAEDFESENPRVLTLEQVDLNKNYTMVISTSSGLWRYKIGDTIRFTELRPYRFLISGRTKHCINIFGEDLFIDHAEKGLARACSVTGAIMENYTAAPKFYESTTKGYHEWVIEFVREPKDLKEFANILDEELSNLNEDYKSKRNNNAAIEVPVVRTVSTGTFYTWLKKNNKLGGQHKITRLSNNRNFVEELLNQDKESLRNKTPDFN